MNECIAGVLGGLVNDAQQLLKDAEALVERGEKEGTSLDLQTNMCFRIDSRFHKGANRLAATPLATLREEGLKTAFTDSELSPMPSCLLSRKGTCYSPPFLT
jgi:hypothetical protein